MSSRLKIWLCRALVEASFLEGFDAIEVLMRLAGLQMVDGHLTTTDGRTLILSRYTQPNPDQALLLKQFSLTLPDQPVPGITQSVSATGSKPLRL